MKINKYLLTLGSVTVAAASTIPALACGSETETPVPSTKEKIFSIPASILSPATLINEKPLATQTKVQPIETSKAGEQLSNIQNHKDSLDERILDVQVSPKVSKEDIIKAFGKFTTNLDFNTGGLMGLFASATKNTDFDKTQKMVKLLIVGQRDGMATKESIFYCGVMGYIVNPTDNSKTLTFLFDDFKDLNDISDNPAKTSVKDLQLQHYLPGNGFDKIVLSGLGNEQTNKIIQFLVDTANREFPSETIELKTA